MRFANLTLSEDLVARASNLTTNPSDTVERLISGYVDAQQKKRQEKELRIDEGIRKIQLVPRMTGAPPLISASMTIVHSIRIIDPRAAGRWIVRSVPACVVRFPLDRGMRRRNPASQAATRYGASRTAA